MAGTVLITGGAGFIGSHLARALAARGEAVHVLARPSTVLRPDRLVAGAVVHRIDLCDPAALRTCLDQVRPDIIYHLATDNGRGQEAPEPADIAALTRDLDNALRLVAAAAADSSRRPGRLIMAQSLAVYGNGPSPSAEDQREAPLAPYTASMVAASHYLAVLQPRLPFPVLHARLGLAYGPGQQDSFFIPWLVRRCLAGVASPVRAPDDRRDLIHVDDVAAGLIAMADTALPGGTILNIASGEAPTIRAVAELIAELTGAAPGLLRFAGAPARDLRSRAVCCRIDRARALLGWTPRVSLREGLARLVDSHATAGAA